MLDRVRRTGKIDDALYERLLSKKGIVIHSDLDGMTSGMLWNTYIKDIPIVGIYDLETLRVNRDYDLRELLYLDLDMTFKDFTSFGHHYLWFNEISGYNANQIYNIGLFHQKCPFPTGMLITMEFDIPYTEAMSALMYACDNYAFNKNKYTKNCEYWESKHQNLLINENVKRLFTEIVAKLGVSNKKMEDCRTKGEIPQNDFQKNVQVVSEVFGRNFHEITDFGTFNRYTFQRNMYYLAQENIDRLQILHDRNQIISHARVNKNLLNATIMV